MTIRTGTVWNTLAAGGTGAVAELVLRSHHEPADPQVPDGEQVLVVDEVRTLDRVGHLPGDSDWLRPVMLATLAARLAPRAAGAKHYQDGWVLLERLDAPAGGMPAGKKLGPARETPLVDLEAGTATWYTLVDLDAGELAAGLAARKTKMRAEINDERGRGIYEPIGPVDVRGDGTLMVEPDIRNERDEANLVSLSLRCTQLAAAGITAAVIPFGAADNVEYMLTPAEMITVAAAPFTRASGRFVRARDLKAAVEAAADHAALDLIDVAAGTVTVEGMPTGGWPG